MADGGGGEALTGEPVAGFSPELRETIAARVAAGESVAQVCRDEGMPCGNTVRSWAAMYPEFGLALRAAYRQARIARRLTDRALAEARAAMPRRRESRRVLAYTPELGEAICDRLAEGESLSSIVRDPAMPCYRTVMKWVRRVPQFEEMYIVARQVQADYLFDEARDVAQAATPKGVWVSRLQFDVIRWQTAILAPRKYCERLVVVQGQVAVAAEAAEAAGASGPMTVIVKRFSDVTDAEVAEAEAHEARLIARGR